MAVLAKNDEFESLQSLKNRFGIVGNSPLLNRALEVSVKVAPTEMNVLVIGESGVGKEVFSKIIHSTSKRKHNNFIAINCGALPEGTIDSELFGHEKGAFTSAVDSRKGYFETVNGGTIFLDEIGELPLETQSRLLRLLENGEFLKVGSSKVQKTDVRIVAATNKDLLEQTQKGKFREDLYYRLSTVTIKLPSLRERKEDIPMLWAKFASDVSDKYRMPPLELTLDGMALLQQFPWPGNIRQMKNIVEQISILEQNRLLNADAIRKYLPNIPGSSLQFSGNTTNSSGDSPEWMIRFLMDIKKEVQDIKLIFAEFLKSTGGTRNNTGSNNNDFNTTYSLPPSTNQGSNLPVVNNGSIPVTDYTYGYGGNDYNQDDFYSSPAINQDNNHHLDHIDVESEVVENESENLSLIKQEKEMIVKALSKHNGKRRLAAEDLGISERTLYRKLKEYDLDN